MSDCSFVWTVTKLSGFAIILHISVPYEINYKSERMGAGNMFYGLPVKYAMHYHSDIMEAY